MDSLPFELQDLIYSNLDLQSLGRVNRTNMESRELTKKRLEDASEKAHEIYNQEMIKFKESKLSPEFRRGYITLDADKFEKSPLEYTIKQDRILSKVDHIGDVSIVISYEDDEIVYVLEFITETDGYESVYEIPLSKDQMLNLLKKAIYYQIPIIN